MMNLKNGVADINQLIEQMREADKPRIKALALEHEQKAKKRQNQLTDKQKYLRVLKGGFR